MILLWTQSSVKKERKAQKYGFQVDPEVHILDTHLKFLRSDINPNFLLISFRPNFRHYLLGNGLHIIFHREITYFKEE